MLKASCALERTLLELDPSDDPAWIYLEAQHRRVLEALKRAADLPMQRHAELVSQHSNYTYDETLAAIDLKSCVSVLEKADVEHLLGNARSQ